MPRTRAFEESAVLEKAVNLFWTKGYASTSMQDVVDALGISRSSIYDTWGDKHGLFVASFKQYRDVNSVRVQKFLERYDEVKEGFRALFETSVKQVCTDPDHKGCFIVNATAELASIDSEMHEMIGRNREHFVDIFESYLDKGAERGQLKHGSDTRVIASTLFTFYSGLNVVGKIDNDPQSLLNSINTMLEVIR